MATNYSTVETGAENSKDFRIYFKNENGVPFSPFHDIPLYVDKSNGIFNMVVEIPATPTNLVKMAIATDETLNPIKFLFVTPLIDCDFSNYGALPQTWQNPNITDHMTGTKGDNDPIDVIEICSKKHRRGDIIQVKVLGCIWVADRGQTDWKLIAIDVNDPEGSEINDIKYICEKRGQIMDRIFQTMKQHKSEEFQVDYKVKNREFALKIIEESHKYWRKLISDSNNVSGLDLTNISVDFSPHRITDSEQILKRVLQ